MALNDNDVLRYRNDVASKGQELSAKEREELLKKYLPAPRARSPKRHASTQNATRQNKKRSKPIRTFIRTKFHYLVYFLIQLFFGIFIRLRQIFRATSDRIIAVLHHHHRTPEYIQRDIKPLNRLPEHLSVILKFRSEDEGGIEALMDDVAELCAWTASAGIPILSVYEKSGILKSYMTSLREMANVKLEAYFGAGSNTPALYLYAPNLNPIPFSPGSSPRLSPRLETGTKSSGNTNTSKPRQRLNLLLLSSSDGRETLVDLTRTLTEMSQAHKIRPRDITSDLINTEISATTAIPHYRTLPDQESPNPNSSPSPSFDKETENSEPDLLIIFGPYVKLDGYPPWQVRLTEIFCAGDAGGEITGSSTRVEYQSFLRALWKFAGAEMRFGR